MEDIYPEIALKQPKADPRTVLLYKRNFSENSSDHIQDFCCSLIYNATTTTATANCDKLKYTCKYVPATTTNANAKKCNMTNLVSTISLKSLSTSASSTFSSSSPLMLSTTAITPSSSLLSCLVNFSKSCHFIASFNLKNYLYKTQKTKLVFFLLLIWCAIFLQTTQAVPVRRVAASGRKLILHTNVYRERYHQKLLEEQRQHNQHQQLLQLQLQDQQRYQQLKQHHQQQQPQQQTLQTHSLPQHLPTKLHLQQQVQRNHIFSPIQTLRRHPQQHQRHHLHQRAAPVTSSQRINMNFCNGKKIYESLYNQMNSSMMYIKQLCKIYLRDRGNQTYDDMSETWKLVSLETRNPNRKHVPIENELHKKIHDFYLDLHSFDQLIEFAYNDTKDNKTKIEHSEEILIETITKFLELVREEVKNNMNEAKVLLKGLSIKKPDLEDDTVEFNNNISRRVRDFLIIKNLIEEFQHVIEMMQTYCENNE